MTIQLIGKGWPKTGRQVLSFSLTLPMSKLVCLLSDEDQRSNVRVYICLILVDLFRLEYTHKSRKSERKEKQLAIAAWEPSH